MPELPHDSSIQKIRLLCQELAAKHGLDEQTRDELCGHLEDKLAGYLSGEVRITEEDALQLVRSHFGDANEIASRLTNPSLAPGLGRNLETHRRAIVAMTALFTPAFQIIWIGVTGGFSWRTGAIHLMMLELGILIAAIVCRKHYFYRLIAALLLLPGISVLCAMLADLSQPWDGFNDVPASALAGACGIVALTGHALLLLMILCPIRLKSSEDRVPTVAP